MKRIITLALATLIFLFCATGCAKEELPKLDALRDKSEFAVYEDGEQIMTLINLPMRGGARFFFNEPYSEYYGDKYKGNPYDLRGANISTKRGIKIGSSMEDVVAAYSGIEFYINLNEEDGYKTIEQIAEREQKQRDGKDDYEKAVSFYTDTLFLQDGSVMSASEFGEYIEENELTYFFIQRNMDKYLKMFYRLGFKVVDGVVIEISLHDEKAAFRID